MRATGEGCSTCKTYRDSGIDLEAIPDSNGGPGDFICSCSICQCPCLKHFSANNLATILLDNEMEKRNLLGTTEEDVHPSLVSDIIGAHLDNGRIALLQQQPLADYDITSSAGAEKLDQDVFAFSSTLLATDPYLHSNAVYRKSFQTAVGPVSNREVRSFYCAMLCAC
jgi:hypothetical protein